MTGSDPLGVFALGDQLLGLAPHNMLLTLMSGGATLPRKSKYSDQVPGGVLLPDGVYLTNMITREYGAVRYPDAYTAELMNKNDGVDITAPSSYGVQVVALRWKRRQESGRVYHWYTYPVTKVHRRDTIKIPAGKTKKVYEGAGHTEHTRGNVHVVDDYYTTVVLTRVI